MSDQEPCCRLCQEYLAAIVRNRSGIDSGEIDFDIRVGKLEALVGRDRENAIHAAKYMLELLRAPAPSGEPK